MVKSLRVVVVVGVVGVLLDYIISSLGQVIVIVISRSRPRSLTKISTALTLGQTPEL